MSILNIKHNVTTKKVIDLIQDSETGLINSNPIGQRPPVSVGYSKYQGIIAAMLKGYSVGELTFRNISNDAIAKKIYPGVNLNSIDGGHRLRAIRMFYRGEFAVNGVLFRDFPDEIKQTFLNTEFNCVEYFCTAAEACEIFRILNTNTPTNEIESIMSDEVSPVARQIRSRTQYYREYDNDVHEIFKLVLKTNGTTKPQYWSTDINPRRKWDEYVGILLAKALERGNGAAGLDIISDLVDSEKDFSSVAYETVDQCLTDIVEISKAVNKKLNGDTFAALQAVWFELLAIRKKFTITDYKKFAEEFFKVHAAFTGKTVNKYDSEIREFLIRKRTTEKKIVKDFVRRAIKNFANEYQQQEVAALYLGEMNLTTCILDLDSVRTKSRDDKFEMLAIQDFKCAIDGLPLDINDAIFGHDTAWAKGGRLEEGKIIRREHNVDMGQLSIEEYRLILKMRNAS